MGERVTRRDWLRGVGAVAAGVVVARAGWGLAGAATQAARRAARVHRVLTCNVLLDLPEHAGTAMEWKAQRRAACEELIRSRAGDVICLQEVGPGQNGDFRRAFPEHASFGYADAYVDRRPRRFQGIKNVILYSRERYELVSAGQYWLSPTPLIAGSHLSGETLNRHVTWVRLRVRGTDREFRVLDTHWSLKTESRQQEATILAAEAGQYPDTFPQVLCGDFNSEPSSPEQVILQEAGWADTYAAVEPPGVAATAPAGAEPPVAGTLTGPAAIGRRKIDFIFRRGPVRPIGAEVFRNNADGRPASDHPFVLADVEI